MNPLTNAQLDTQKSLRDSLENVVRQAWKALGTYYGADVPRFLAVVVPAVEAAQRQSILLTNAYVAGVAGVPPSAVDVQTVLDGVRRGVSLEEEYRRPFLQVWGALNRGKSPEDAIAEGENRAVMLARTDVQAASIWTMRAVRYEVSVGS